MSLLLHLPPELEAKLGEQAKAAGKALEEVALQLIQDQLGSEPPTEPSLSAEEWVTDIRGWALKHRVLDTEADDSRESIYAGREE